MQAKHLSHHGKTRETAGKIISISVSMETWKHIEEAVEVKNEMNDLVDETTVLQKFHLSKKRLCNCISAHVIPRRDYTVAFNKSKWFFMSRLLGLKALFTRQYRKAA